MNVINLSEDFKPLNEGVNVIPTSIITFSGGEPHVQVEINEDLVVGDQFLEIAITARLHTSEEVLRLGLLVDAIKRLTTMIELKLVLLTPYFPGARQDRVMNPGEALSVKFYGDYINNLGFAEVCVLDPHSDAVGLVLNNVQITNNHLLVKHALAEIRDAGDTVEFLVSPDAGADKKVNTLIKELDGLEVVRCGKDRDVKTGSITGFAVYADDLKGANCVIVDDICDGGGTFLGLAKELKAKGAGKLYLIVTHGIFSKGTKKLSAAFEAVYTTDSFPSVDDPYFCMKNDNYIHNIHQVSVAKCYT